MIQYVCMYACINVLMKLMYFQQMLYLLGVNKYYGYGYGYGYGSQGTPTHTTRWTCDLFNCTIYVGDIRNDFDGTHLQVTR